MKNLATLNKYFVKYKWRLLLGIAFVTISNLFAVISPQVVRDVFDEVQQQLSIHKVLTGAMRSEVLKMVFRSGMLLLGLAIMRGIFMFFMRQTIIVMSRLIEFDQKNEIYKQYQELHTQFYKTHFTGDLMNRM